MKLMAITRQVSASINRCEISFHTREPIDLERAIAQHTAYQKCLEQLGAQVVSLPPEPDLPDSVFVEDAALVFDEVAVIPIMGAPSRRRETETLRPVLARYRRVEFLRSPASLDGGDVLRAGWQVFVGLTHRTNDAGIAQLRELLRPHGYTVTAVAVRNVLHLKSACSYLGNNTVLINHAMLQADAFNGFEQIAVPNEEPAAANALVVNGAVIVPESFPATHTILESRGFRVKSIDVSELQKAEAGVTCCSLIFRAVS